MIDTEIKTDKIHDVMRPSFWKNLPVFRMSFTLASLVTNVKYFFTGFKGLGAPTITVTDTGFSMDFSNAEAFGTVQVNAVMLQSRRFGPKWQAKHVKGTRRFNVYRSEIKPLYLLLSNSETDTTSNYLLEIYMHGKPGEYDVLNSGVYVHNLNGSTFDQLLAMDFPVYYWSQENDPEESTAVNTAKMIKQSVREYFSDAGSEELVIDDDEPVVDTDDFVDS